MIIPGEKGVPMFVVDIILHDAISGREGDSDRAGVLGHRVRPGQAARRVHQHRQLRGLGQHQDGLTRPRHHQH